MHKFWLDKRTPDGNYTCPTNGCGRDLKLKTSNSAANPGKTFVSCDEKYSGCGLFCFTFKEPDPKFTKKLEATAAAQKRPRDEADADSGSGGNSKNFRVDGTSVTGQVAYPPSATDARVAELANEVATLRQMLQAQVDQLAVACAYIKETTDH